MTLPPEYAYFFDQDLLRLLSRLARYKFVARIIKRSDRLLQIGCGSGLGSIFLSQHCELMVGRDVNSGELNEAHSVNRRLNVEFKHADVFELDGSGKFDVVVALDVIDDELVHTGFPKMTWYYFVLGFLPRGRVR